MKSFNGLNAGQEERLHLLQEECAEVIQACSKILRHGYLSYHPEKTYTTNKMDLEIEIGHVMNAFNMLVSAKDIDSTNTHNQSFIKSQTVVDYLHHQSKKMEV